MLLGSETIFRVVFDGTYQLTMSIVPVISFREIKLRRNVSICQISPQQHCGHSASNI
jgi:hypothetical protein